MWSATLAQSHSCRAGAACAVSRPLYFSPRPSPTTELRYRGVYFRFTGRTRARAALYLRPWRMRPVLRIGSRCLFSRKTEDTVQRVAAAVFGGCSNDVQYLFQLDSLIWECNEVRCLFEVKTPCNVLLQQRRHLTPPVIDSPRTGQHGRDCV